MTVELHLGDCLPFMKSLADKSIDCVLTDPPYGIGEDGGAQRRRNRPGYSKYEKKGWDKERPNKEYFDLMLSVSTNQVIWGGNYFSDYLPPRMRWLYWQKLMGGDFSDGELAWTSFDKSLREYTKCPKGIDKSHPTEKPIELMKWCLELATNEGDTIFDPFMGSGTTGVACVQTGRNFIGCEIDEGYFKIAEKRIAQAQLQERMPI